MSYNAVKDGSTYSIYKKTTRTYYKRSIFNPSSSIQTYTVPAGITSLSIDCVASSGYTAVSGSKTGTGGKGGRVTCKLSVTPGQILNIMVGAVPTTTSQEYNASDIRIGGTALSNRVIVAGGGGSGSASSLHGVAGGKGGKTTGGDGAASNTSYGTAATGGTQSAGGTGAHNSTYGSLDAGDGELGLGGTPAIGGNAYTGNAVVGAGGAGYYGGGGALAFGVYFGSSQYGTWGYGGGGGSSYTDSTLCSSVSHTRGYKDGAGYINIVYVSNSSDYDYYTDTTVYKAFNT